MITTKNQQTSGFALLISLIVVGVVVSVGLTILDLTIKQLSLSTNSKDSEIAFHAANAGLECAQYWRLKEFQELEDGNTVIFECFGDNIMKSSDPVAVLEGDAHRYDFEFSWGGVGAERCSRVAMVLLNSDNNSSGVEIGNMQTILPGYSGGSTKTCEPGGRCTIISVQGYNKSCGSIGSAGTIQREVLLES